MDIAGHVSKQMRARHSHIRMEAKRKAVEGIVNKPAAPRPSNPLRKRNQPRLRPCSSSPTITRERSPGPSSGWIAPQAAWGYSVFTHTGYNQQYKEGTRKCTGCPRWFEQVMF